MANKNPSIEIREIRKAYASLLNLILNYDRMRHPITPEKINQLIELQEKASLLDLVELNNFRVDVGGKT